MEREYFFMILFEIMINFQLSRHAKEAIKVALAFSIAYLIALQAGWLIPFWAALTVGQIALFPNAQSLHNGALRLLGLIPAVLVAILIFAVANQNRWLFASLASLWMMLATYLMIKDKKRSYLWNVAGFVPFIFLTIQYTSSTELFHHIAARVLDAITGIVIYTLVMVFLWPDSNISTLKTTCTQLSTIQDKIFTLITTQNNSLQNKNLLKQAIKQELFLIDTLKQSFFAKGSESYEVQEATEFWKEYYSLSIQLGQSFSRMNNSILGLDNIDLYKLLPDLKHYRKTINHRFIRASDILKNGNQNFSTETLHLSINEAYFSSLKPFDQFAFISSKNELETVEKLSQKILRCANNIMDDSVHKKEASKKIPLSIYDYLIPDIDTLHSLLFVGSFVFSIFCVWIYFDPPGHMMWFYIPPTVAMLVASNPRMKTNQMVIPAFFILGFFMLVYSVILPTLSGVLELFSILFICMFLVFYYLNGVHRVIGVIAVSTKLMLSNAQTYDFAHIANMTLLSIGAYISIYIFSYLLDSPKPQRALLKQMHRYYKSAYFLASTIVLKNASKKPISKSSILLKFKIAFYRYEVKTLPFKLPLWSSAIDHQYFYKNTPDAVGDLLLSLHALSNSFEEWLNANHLLQRYITIDNVQNELENWEKSIERIFQGYTHNLDNMLYNNIQKDLNRHIKTLEDIINCHTKEIKEKNLSKVDKEHIFRLIGSYQGLSLALISYASIAEQIDWTHWEEEVFA